MFTGIITGVGHIAATQPLGADASFGQRLSVSTPAGYLNDVQLGDSIAIDGACMTVTAFDATAAHFSVDVSAESHSKTAALDIGAAVNLEKALRAHDRLGGHLVTGHVDGVGEVTHFAAVGESWGLRIAAPRALAKFLAVKGSVTVNGVSLTVNAVRDNAQVCEIAVNLIPHTLTNTSLSYLVVGRHVNLEIDLIARYVERMVNN